jgi:hypothetical protein
VSSSPNNRALKHSLFKSGARLLLRAQFFFCKMETAKLLQLSNSDQYFLNVHLTHTSSIIFLLSLLFFKISLTVHFIQYIYLNT